MDDFGDHKLKIYCIDEPKEKIVTHRRDWRHYSKEILCTELSMINWSINIEDVQGFWNTFEKKLLHVVDKIIPMTKFVNNAVKEPVPRYIKNKLNE